MFKLLEKGFGPSSRQEVISLLQYNYDMAGYITLREEIVQILRQFDNSTKHECGIYCICMNASVARRMMDLHLPTNINTDCIPGPRI